MKIACFLLPCADQLRSSLTNGWAQLFLFSRCNAPFINFVSPTKIWSVQKVVEGEERICFQLKVIKKQYLYWTQKQWVKKHSTITSCLTLGHNFLLSPLLASLGWLSASDWHIYCHLRFSLASSPCLLCQGRDSWLLMRVRNQCVHVRCWAVCVMNSWALTDVGWGAFAANSAKTN